MQILLRARIGAVCGQWCLFEHKTVFVTELEPPIGSFRLLSLQASKKKLAIQQRNSQVPKW
jgi:hypothetical protein